MPDYSKEQLQELYNSLPKELQNALYSQENTLHIKEICDNNYISESDAILKVSKSIGHTLLGLLPPDEMAGALANELKITAEEAEKISNDITRLILMPVKKILEGLYGKEIKLKDIPPTPSAPSANAYSPETQTPPPAPADVPKGPDGYRESTE